MKNILMNAEMTKAILDGRKVQTRRVIKYGYYTIPNDMNEHSIEVMRNYCDLDENNIPELKSEMIKHAKYQIDETIWVREPAKVVSVHGFKMNVEYLADNHKTTIGIPKRFYKTQPASSIINYVKWISLRQGIPNGCIKEMARIFLKITNVRVERLQDISSHDIFAEGIPAKNSCSLQEASADAKEKWIKLWNSTAPNGYKWEDNPYVFVFEFERGKDENS